LSTDASRHEGRNHPKRKKKKTKSSGLDKATEERASKINELRKRYYCNEHGQPCYVDENGHLKLTAAHLTIWAYDCICIAIFVFFFFLFVTSHVVHLFHRYKE